MTKIDVCLLLFYFSIAAMVIVCGGLNEVKTSMSAEVLAYSRGVR